VRSISATICCSTLVSAQCSGVSFAIARTCSNEYDDGFATIDDPIAVT